MNKLKIVLTSDKVKIFEDEIKKLNFKLIDVFTQNDSYFRNIDMQTSISKHTVRVRHEIKNNKEETYKITFSCLTESSDEWAKFSEVCSICDENIYRILLATGFKRLATLSKLRHIYEGPFKMTRDDIIGFGTVIKAYFKNEYEKKQIEELFNKLNVPLETQTNLQMVLKNFETKTAPNKDEGIKKAKSEIFKLLNQKQNLLIAIAGGSGSGKTFIANELLSWLPDATIFTLDDYYKDREWIIKNLNSNFDDPNAINLDLAREHLLMLKNGMKVMRPKRSLELGKVVGQIEVNPCKLIIVEGIFALIDKLADLYDYSIFIEANLHGKLLRRIMRDIGKTGQDFEGILLQYVSTVQPMYEKYIEVTKNYANLIINNEFAPYCETYEQLNKFEFKLKSQLNVPISQIQNQNLKLISKKHQTDKYYVAPGLNFMESDELLRIREEDGKLYLTYKGPRRNAIQRPRIDFPINIKFAEVLLYLGYSNVITVEKTRYKFLLLNEPDLDIVIDDVKNLGAFIEVRVKNQENIDKAKNFLKSLGLTIHSENNKGYFEEVLKKFI